MYRSPRVLRRSRLILILLCSFAFLWPMTTTQSSATPLPQPQETVVADEVPKVLTEREQIKSYIWEISALYAIDPYLVESVVEHESNYVPTAVSDSGRSIGLMQIGKRWHAKRMDKLGVQDLTDPRSNILTGVDYLSELIANQKDLELALMVYNMGPSKASELYTKGKISAYAKSVIHRAHVLKTGGE